MAAARIVLASASPRRRALLGETGLDFAIEPADVDESFDEALEPEEAACLLAERKARVVAREHGADGVIVLAADTIVALEDVSASDLHSRYLAKPADAAEARAMLRALSNSRHRVVTGVCALAPSSGRIAVASETTFVTMRTIEPHEIESYVKSGEWRDKAGGYAIQETADRFVTSLEGGGLDNVVGLPVVLALDCLRRVRDGDPHCPDS